MYQDYEWVGGSSKLEESGVGQWVRDKSGFRTGGSVGCDGRWDSKCTHEAEERNPEVLGVRRRARRRARIPQSRCGAMGHRMHAARAARRRARSAQVDESIPSDPISQNISVHSKCAHLTYRAFE